MSTATPNFFSVLGEDSGPNVGTGAVHLDGTPKVAATASSKKTDVNPKADPAKARKKAPGNPSNDRVFRENKEGGRANNRRVPVKEGAPQHHSRRSERTDRVPRSTKRDTSKRTRAGWGDDNDEPKEEVAGEEIAQEQKVADAADSQEPEAEAEEAEPEAPKLSLEEYLQQQREAANALNTRSKKAAAPAATAPATEAKRTEATPEQRKKNSTKPRKEVQTLEIDSSAAPPLLNNKERAPRPARTSGPRSSAPRSSGARGSGPRGSGPRGEKSSGKGGKAASGSAKSSKPSFDLGSLPSLN